MFRKRKSLESVSEYITLLHNRISDNVAEMKAIEQQRADLLQNMNKLKENNDAIDVEIQTQLSILPNPLFQNNHLLPWDILCIVNEFTDISFCSACFKSYPKYYHCLYCNAKQHKYVWIDGNLSIIDKILSSDDLLTQNIFDYISKYNADIIVSWCMDIPIKHPGSMVTAENEGHFYITFCY